MLRRASVVAAVGPRKSCSPGVPVRRLECVYVYVYVLVVVQCRDVIVLRSRCKAPESLQPPAARRGEVVCRQIQASAPHCQAITY